MSTNTKLAEALHPFVLANSSEEHITLVVRTADVARARAALAAHDAEQEPVAWRVWRGDSYELFFNEEAAKRRCECFIRKGKPEPLYAAPTEQAAQAVPADMLPSAEHIKEIAGELVTQAMEQAQVFASAWALVGSRFDAGNEMDNAEQQKADLRTIIQTLADLAAETVRPIAAAPAAPAHQPVHGWTDADADAARLALELECRSTPTPRCRSRLDGGARPMRPWRCTGSGWRLSNPTASGPPQGSSMVDRLDCKYFPHPEYRYWLYDPEGDGMTYWRTAEERDKAAERVIATYLSDCWAEETEHICAGEITHIAQVKNKVVRPDDLDEDGIDGEGNYWEPDMAWRGNYTLEPIGATTGEQR